MQQVAVWGRLSGVVGSFCEPSIEVQRRILARLGELTQDTEKKRQITTDSRNPPLHLTRPQGTMERCPSRTVRPS